MNFRDAFTMNIKHEFAGKIFCFSMVDSKVEVAAFLEIVISVFDIVQGFTRSILEGSNELIPC